MLLRMCYEHCDLLLKKKKKQKSFAFFLQTHGENIAKAEHTQNLLSHSKNFKKTKTYRYLISCLHTGDPFFFQKHVYLVNFVEDFFEYS